MHPRQDTRAYCFKLLFGAIDTKHLEIFNIISPQTRSFCHIDLIHKKYTVNVWAEEVYVPYIRVTNSYNRTRALTFDIGFCRKLCDNGVIFEKMTIGFSYSHTRQDIGTRIVFDVKTDDLKRLENQFVEYMNGLAKIGVPRKYSLAIMSAGLGLSFDLENPNPRRRDLEAQKCEVFKGKSLPLLEKYHKCLGENAYAIFNAMTDYASNPGDDGNSFLATNGLQKKAGKWAEEFGSAAKEGGFALDEYLKYYRHLFIG